MFSCDFITFHCFVIFDEAFNWPNWGWFRLAEFGQLYFSFSELHKVYSLRGSDVLNLIGTDQKVAPYNFVLF